MLGLLYYSTKSNIFGEEEGFICGSIEMVNVWKVPVPSCPISRSLCFDRRRHYKSDFCYNDENSNGLVF